MGTFMAGTASVDITPYREELKEFVEICGSDSNSTLFPGGVIRPLMAKVLATRTENTAIILISIDHHSTPDWLSGEIRRIISGKLGIGVEAVSVCTSQNHSAPMWAGPDTDRMKTWKYTVRFIELIVNAAEGAWRDLRPASIGTTIGYCHDISYNDSVPITSETPVKYYPDSKHIGGMIFARNHIIGRSSGRPFDPEVGVVRIDDADNNPMAVIFNFSAHPATCINGEYIHGDFVGFAADRIESELPGVTALFLQGSLGNAQIIPIFGTWQDARRTGEKLADEVLRVLPDAVMAQKVVSSAVSEVFPVRFIPYTTECLKRYVEYVNEYLKELEINNDAEWLGEGPYTLDLPPGYTPDKKREYVAPILKYCEKKLAGRERNEPESLEPRVTEIQVFRWNETALCMHALEMYYQTGLEIKRISPSRYTFPTGNANMLVGYVMPEEEFQYGGYMAFTSPMYNNLPGMWDPGNCKRIIERFKDLMLKIVETEVPI